MNIYMGMVYTMWALIDHFESESLLLTKWYNDPELWDEFMHDIEFYMIYRLEAQNELA